MSSGVRLPFAAAAKALLRDTILDAAVDLIRRDGWTATTMSALAKTAGVSRQTLYNEFGSRQAVAEAYVMREIGALLDAAEFAIRANQDDAAMALGTAIQAFLTLATDEPLVSTLAVGASEGELFKIVTTVALDVATERLSAVIRDLWPEVSDEDARAIIDAGVRLAISNAVVPRRAPAETAREIQRLIAPFVLAATAPSS